MAIQGAYGTAPRILARTFEVLSGRFNPIPGERGATGPEQRLRPGRRYLACATGRFQEMLFRCGEIAAVERNVSEPEHRLGGVFESFGKGEIEPSRNLGLSCRERRGSDGQAALQHLTRFRCIVSSRSAGAGAEEEESGHRRDPEQASDKTTIATSESRAPRSMAGPRSRRQGQNARCDLILYARLLL